MNTADIDTTNMCSHLRHKLMDNEGVYHHLWQQINDDPELTAVVCSRQLHIYRNAKKVLVLKGKAEPQIVKEDKNILISILPINYRKFRIHSNVTKKKCFILFSIIINILNSYAVMIIAIILKLAPF